jgi:hypothetical protein
MEEMEKMLDDEEIKDFFRDKQGQSFCLNNFIRVKGKWEYHFRKADLLEKMMISGRKKSYG